MSEWLLKYDDKILHETYGYGVVIDTEYTGWACKGGKYGYYIWFRIGSKKYDSGGYYKNCKWIDNDDIGKSVKKVSEEEYNSNFIPWDSDVYTCQLCGKEHSPQESINKVCETLNPKKSDKSYSGGTWFLPGNRKTMSDQSRWMGRYLI